MNKYTVKLLIEGDKVLNVVILERNRRLATQRVHDKYSGAIIITVTEEKGPEVDTIMSELTEKNVSDDIKDYITAMYTLVNNTTETKKTRIRNSKKEKDA